ncbi:hypothetical protein HK097_004952 [Rhizophlyctis rosea]|uniref:Uncharacterized protein n=1 Tax=Rhizophlyctis rosea TaxID=64517 RepID=A0AAD5WZ72_9FUNG|nr:hypothetical protein HK097_004952 [Rhizophlyctis rosea]
MFSGQEAIVTRDDYNTTPHERIPPAIDSLMASDPAILEAAVDDPENEFPDFHSSSSDISSNPGSPTTSRRPSITEPNRHEWTAIPVHIVIAANGLPYAFPPRPISRPRGCFQQVFYEGPTYQPPPISLIMGFDGTTYVVHNPPVVFSPPMFGCGPLVPVPATHPTNAPGWFAPNAPFRAFFVGDIGGPGLSFPPA